MLESSCALKGNGYPEKAVEYHSSDKKICHTASRRADLCKSILSQLGPARHPKSRPNATSQAMGL